MHLRRYLHPLASVAVASVLLVACGGDDEPSPPAGDAPPAETSATDSAGADAPKTVRLDEFSFEPAEVTVERGAVIEASNVGSTVHNVTIERGTTPTEPSDELAATPTFPAGEQHSLEVDLDPGRYSLVCTVPGHREAGMVGTLTVAP